jgi:hypothetical protein
MHTANVGSKPVNIEEGYPLAEFEPLIVDPTRPHNKKVSFTNMTIPTKPGPKFENVLNDLDINPSLTSLQKEELKVVLRQNHFAFAYGNRSLGNSDILKMDIDSSDAKPISQPPYHASPNAWKFIQENIAQLLSDDVIEESDSPWVAPAILVHQKCKDHFCIDYRKLNEVTKVDQYPLPYIDDNLSQFSGKNFFTTFDAHKGSNQIQITEEDRHKTAFRTHQGLHQYKRMLFKLRNEPSVFQRFLDKVLGRYKWQCVFVYPPMAITVRDSSVPDVRAYAARLEEVHAKAREMLRRARESARMFVDRKPEVGRAGEAPARVKYLVA